MRKCTALTALVIALNITMLALTVSASQVSASWAAPCYDPVPLTLESNCIRKCKSLVVEKEKQACLSKCVVAFEAARRTLVAPKSSECAVR
jgi:hypothetical protein